MTNYRDEDASCHLVRSQQELQHSKILIASKKVSHLGPKPALIGTAFGRSVRAERGNNGVLPEMPKAEEKSTILAVASLESNFLVCAGTRVASNNNSEEFMEGACKWTQDQSLPFEKARATLLVRSDPSKKQAAASSSLNRTDSELELIISELREQISLQHRMEESKRKAALADQKVHPCANSHVALDSSRSTGSNSESYLPHHPRKHLKNAIERVHGNQGSSETDSATFSSHAAWERQQALSHLNTDSAIQLAAPTIIATSISTASLHSRTSLAPLNGNLHPSNSRDGDTDVYTRVYDDEGMSIKSYTSESCSIGSNYGRLQFHSSTSIGTKFQKPIVYRTEPTVFLRKPLIRKLKPERPPSLNLEFERAENNRSDSDGSFSSDEENPCSLSPMGPWIADGRESSDAYDSLSGSKSFSPTLSSNSTEDELAGLSPRSRLLWFSQYADTWSLRNPQLSSDQQFQRCSSHSDVIRPSSAAVKSSVKVHGAKPPVRCSSAKPSFQGSRTNTIITRGNIVASKSTYKRINPELARRSTMRRNND